MNAVLGVHLKYRHLFLLISGPYVSQHTLLYSFYYLVRFKAREELSVANLRRGSDCRR